MADFGRDPRVATAEEPGDFLSGKQCTISPISRLPNFTKFPNKTSIAEAMKTFGTVFGKFFRKWSFKKRKYPQNVLTSCDFRRP